MKLNPIFKFKSIIRSLFSILICIALFACQQKKGFEDRSQNNTNGQPVYVDEPYDQEYAIKYYINENTPATMLSSVSADRNYHIHVLSGNSILVPTNGSLMYPGSLITDKAYAQMLSKKIKAISTYQDHTIYLDEKQIFSNAWAGSLQIDHQMPEASLFAAGNDFDFLVSDGNTLRYLDKNSTILWEKTFPELLK